MSPDKHELTSQNVVMSKKAVFPNTTSVIPKRSGGVSLAMHLRKRFLHVFEMNGGIENFSKLLQFIELHPDAGRRKDWKWATDKVFELMKQEQEKSQQTPPQIIVNKVVVNPHPQDIHRQETNTIHNIDYRTDEIVSDDEQTTYDDETQAEP